MVYMHRTMMCLPSLMRQVPKSGSIVALLIVFNFIQRYSPPLTGVIAGENEGVKPHVIARFTLSVLCAGWFN
jgi:hypothetical protein